MTLIAINVFGIALIGTIIWWFWLYKPEQRTVTGNQIDVRVENGVYDPARVVAPAHHAFTIRFHRKDPSHCAEQVLFPDLEIHESLPLNRDKDIAFPGLEPGLYPFHCQMQMYRGQIEVKE